MVLPHPLCLFDRHKPRRRAAQWDGVEFTSRCKRCKKPIKRIAHNFWKRDRSLQS